MPALVIGLVVLLLLLWAAGVLSKADPSNLAAKAGRLVRPVGGVGALALAVFLGARGEIAVAVPLGFAGLSLLGWLPFGPAGFGQRTSKAPGQVSRVRSAFLEMELDHDTGAMRGRILAGPHEGVTLDALGVATLVGL